MKIVLKGAPPSMNKFAGRKNTYEYRNQKQKYTQLVKILCRQNAQMPKEPIEKALVRIDYFFPTAGRRDPDNYSGKMLIDGLTKAGVIADDSFSYIALALHGHKDKDFPRTEITIVPMLEV